MDDIDLPPLGAPALAIANYPDETDYWTAEQVREAQRAAIAADRAKGGEAVAWRHSHTHDLHDREEDVQLADADSWAEPLFTRPAPAPEMRDELSDAMSEQWKLIDPHGAIRATEDTCIKAWARIDGYKLTVEGLLGYEQQGWRVEPSRAKQHVEKTITGMGIAPGGIAELSKLMREQRASRLGVYPDGNPNAALSTSPAPTQARPDPMRELLADQAEVIDMDRLGKALVRMGISYPESRESMWCRFGQLVNALTYVVSTIALPTRSTQERGAERVASDVLASFVHEVYMGAYKPEELQERARVALITAAAPSIEDICGRAAMNKEGDRG